MLVDSSPHPPSLQPVSVLTEAASGTVLCWHWWLHRAHPMHSGWKLNLAFSWSRIGDKGDRALSHWQAGPEPYLWHGQIKETIGRENPEDLMLLGNSYSKKIKIQFPLKKVPIISRSLELPSCLVNGDRSYSLTFGCNKNLQTVWWHDTGHHWPEGNIIHYNFLCN